MISSTIKQRFCLDHVDVGPTHISSQKLRFNSYKVIEDELTATDVFDGEKNHQIQACIMMVNSYFPFNSFKCSFFSYMERTFVQGYTQRPNVSNIYVYDWFWYDKITVRYNRLDTLSLLYIVSVMDFLHVLTEGFCFSQ